MKPELPDPSEANPTADWLEVVRRNVSQLRYGSVQITVHDGRVTQVESLARTRFPASAGDDRKPRPGDKR